MPRAVLRAAGLLFVAFILGGCQRSLMPTPVVLQSGRLDPFENTPEAFRTPTVDVLYVTGRNAHGPATPNAASPGSAPARGASPPDYPDRAEAILRAQMSPLTHPPASDEDPE